MSIAHIQAIHDNVLNIYDRKQKTCPRSAFSIKMDRMLPAFAIAMASFIVLECLKQCQPIHTFEMLPVVGVQLCVVVYRY